MDTLDLALEHFEHTLDQRVVGHIRGVDLHRLWRRWFGGTGRFRLSCLGRRGAIDPPPRSAIACFGLAFGELVLGCGMRGLRGQRFGGCRGRPQVFFTAFPPPATKAATSAIFSVIASRTMHASSNARGAGEDLIARCTDSHSAIMCTTPAASNR